MIFPVKVLAGRLDTDELVKTRPAAALLAFIFPEVRDTVDPEMVSVFAPTVKVPLVSASVPDTEVFPSRLTPELLLIVRCEKATPD